MNERKTPTAELRQTPTNDIRDGFDKESGWGDEEAKAKLVAEQARIQQHYKRLVQQRKDYEQSGGDLVDEVYQGQAEIRAERPDRIDRGERSERSERGERGERGERSDHKDSLPASLVAARPGSRSGITGLSSDPRFGNYNDEIQRHLNRRQAQYHSQRREHPARSDRPVSNFYEYESVQSNISHGRQVSQRAPAVAACSTHPGCPS